MVVLDRVGLDVAVRNNSRRPIFFEGGGLGGDHSVVCFRPFDLLSVHRLCLFFSQGLSVLSENRVFHLGGGAWVDSEDTCRLELFDVCA